jgi:glycosyltransferase involved in cell wall biosynthesis
MSLKQLLSYWPLYIFIFLCAISFIQFLYNIIIFLRVGIYKKKQKASILTQPVSIVICARDEAENLENNLPEVLNQQYPYTHEVVVVNDNSFDDTSYFLEGLQKLFRHLNPINLLQEAKHIPGKKYPLSIGIKTSKYETLLLTDADCKPTSNEWLQIMQDTYTPGKEIILGYGSFYKQPGIFNKLARFETFHTAIQYLGYAIAGMPYMGVGRNLSYQKKLFYENKGFSSINHIPGGDDDLFINKIATKQNTAVAIDKNAFTLSKAPQNFSQWWRQKSRHYSTAKFYKSKHKFLLGLYAITHAMLIPATIATALFYSWKLAACIYAFRLLYTGIIWIMGMNKLNEKDLRPWFWLLDIWQFFYYIIFSFTLLKKPKTTWK